MDLEAQRDGWRGDLNDSHIIAVQTPRVGMVLQSDLYDKNEMQKRSHETIGAISSATLLIRPTCWNVSGW